MSDKDGGPAFPIPHIYSHGGMSLRDWFAAQYLAGIMANNTMVGDPKDFARFAYRFADAMLAEREKTND